MSRNNAYDDDDRRPSRAGQPTYPALTASRQPKVQQRPWSHEAYSSEDEYDGDGGAIATYLEMERARQERGQGTAGVAGPSGDHWQQDDEGTPLDRGRGQSRRSLQNRAGEPAQIGQLDEDYERPRGSGRHYNRRGRQEPSDISVEALDLADYANEFSYRKPFPEFKRQSDLARGTPVANQVATNDYTRYPQSFAASPHHSLPQALDDAPPRERPFSAQSRRSRGTVESGRTSLGPPPSFVSARERLTPPSSQHSHSGSPRSAKKTRKEPKSRTRHMSLPPVFIEPGDIMPNTQPTSTTLNVSEFPKWSRGWYDLSSRPCATVTPSSLPDPYNETDLGVWPSQAAPLSTHAAISAGTGSALPWGHTVSHPGHTLQMSEPPQYVPDSVREERMRMLEKEFGRDNGKGKHPFIEGQGMIGSVDANGSLITDGPRARTTVRVMQSLLALIAAVSGIYGAMAIHPPTPAPPAAKTPAYVLYAFSVISFLFSIYFFGIRPCVRRRKHGKGDGYTGYMGAPGMMILPVMQGIGAKGKSGSKGGTKKKGKRGPEDGVQVNLIVDPSMFGGDGSGRERRSRRRRDEEEGDSDISSSSESNGFSQSKRHHQKPKRQSVFEAIALENDWKAARRTLKWQFTVDILFMLLWSCVFFYVMFGKRCPPGGFEGWCTTYNISSACACLLAFAYAFGIYYDIKDLSASKVSPRTRT
ncbi:hypothetical protein FRB96_002433 [Tulasnella sp. 330]|nr:hypothetical protein FRB96_002433 [Tulasnella sp. 330]KAG8889935.1 hypothetical protein FRB98_001981 [Tulasnella sp. 332]